MIGGIEMIEYNYWKFICKLKNYYYGNLHGTGKTVKELKNRIEWFNNYFNVFNNPKYLQMKDLPDLYRGDVVLVELGFNIGMEFGGRHYCIVLRDSAKCNKRVVILPITSKKPSDYQKLKDSIYVQFDDIKFLHCSDDYSSSTPFQRWCNILNVKTISKSRIIYPIRRDLPSPTKRISKRKMTEISNKIISEIALRNDLLELQDKYKVLEYNYNKLLSKKN